MSWETLGAAAIGGLMTLLGSGVTLYFQKKLQDGKFAHEQQKAREDWERQEERREERSFELKRQAYQNIPCRDRAIVSNSHQTHGI